MRSWSWYPPSVTATSRSLPRTLEQSTSTAVPYNLCCQKWFIMNIRLIYCWTIPFIICLISQTTHCSIIFDMLLLIFPLTDWCWTFYFEPMGNFVDWWKGTPTRLHVARTRNAVTFALDAETLLHCLRNSSFKYFLLLVSNKSESISITLRPALLLWRLVAAITGTGS